MLYTNFMEPIWYTIESDKDSLAPTRFLLKPLPYRMYALLVNRQPLESNLEYRDFTSQILNSSIVGYENIEGTSSNWISTLPQQLQQELLAVIMRLFIPTGPFMESLAVTVEMSINPKFQGDSWDCTKCQERKIHFQKNCPYLPEEDHDPDFYVQVLGVQHAKCPRFLVDNALAQASFEAHSINSGGSLPEAGGLGDQTVFYSIASQKMHNSIEHHNNQAQMDSIKK